MSDLDRVCGDSGMHDDDTPLLDTDGRLSWAVHLTKFERDVWPAFKKQGFARDTALLVFTMNRVSNALSIVQETLEDLGLGEEE